jgi:cell division protein FtsB
MRTIQRRKNWLASLLVPAMLACCLGYFSTHAQDGQYGLAATAELKAQLATRIEAREALTRQREHLEQRVRLLEDGTLERDMLDERVRQSLNFLTTDEITILR